MKRERHIFISAYVHMYVLYICIYIYTWPRRAALPGLIGLDLGAGSLLGWLPSGRQACWQAIWPSDCVLPSRLYGCLARWLASWLGDWSEADCPAGWLDSNVVACLPA